jgi:hypothetical protein
MTLERPEMDSQGQIIARTRVSLTSSRPQELLIGQLLHNVRACEENPTSSKIQNKYFYSPYSNKFTNIAVQQMRKSSRDNKDFLDMKFRIFGQAVSKYMIVSVCVIF